MKTNDIVYKVSKTKGGIVYDITISLNDEHKNGHQDFSITGYSYPAGKAKNDRNMIGGGAMGDEIAAKFPQFELINSLHLADCNGAPMYAFANGYYHLRKGFNNTKSDSESFPAEFCKYYRIPLEFWSEISEANSATHYAIILSDLGVPKIWKSQADEAIKQLETLTGSVFLNDSKRSNLDAISDEKIEEEKIKIESGFYSAESVEKRHKESIDVFLSNLKEKAEKDKQLIDTELLIQSELYKIGGKRLLDSAIYYKHINSIGFNWRGYGEKIPVAEIDQIMKTNPILSGFKYDFK